jgi:hypothetical protein
MEHIYLAVIIGVFGTGIYWLGIWQGCRKTGGRCANTSTNNARDEIHDCDVCENGTVRLPSFRDDLYRYCPWCSRELSPIA